MEYVGIDVATKSCSAFVMNEAGRIKKCLDEFVNGETGWGVLKACIERDARIVMEAGTAANRRPTRRTP